ncbi:MAG TPA: DUF1015 domain-containing protein [Verrucomicrobiae bacterium]|nr:DUF1015 domain-containing protein [Verrucomicrobiae bacterium]
MDAKTKTLADFRPFRAWRYDTQKVRPSEVIAPPYDVISPEVQQRLYAKSPYNCIRLILNQIQDSDTETNSRYTRARDFFQKWREEGTLVQDSKPRFDLYQQQFKDPRSGRSLTRYAILGALKLEPFENHIVIPHEKTLAKARADQKFLIQAAQANFSPIFGLYEDADGQVAGLLPKIAAQKPYFEAVDEDAVQHKLWSIDDSATCEKIHKAMAAQRVYIADGHHRYTISLEHAQEQRKKLGNPAKLLASDFVYTALVSFEDSGLVLFPTHRLITGVKNFDAAKTVDALKEFFTVEKMEPEKVMPKMEAAPQDASVLGFVTDANTGYFLTLKDEKKARAKMPAGKPDVWYRLDVNICAYLILKGILGIDEAGWETQLKFTHSDPESLAEVRDKKVQAAFLLKPPQVRVLGEMGKVRELMPQKSTYFYPKLASGLLFFQHDEKAI